EVIQSMTIHTLKAATLSLLILTAGAGGLFYSLNAVAQPREGRPIAQEARTEPRLPDVTRLPDPARPAPGRMTIAGRVLDPTDKSVPGAAIDVITRFRAPSRSSRDGTQTPLTVLGQARSDESGRFRIDSPRTAADRVFRVYAIAAAPGYGLGWVALDPDAEEPAAEIRLLPEQILSARLTEISGAPARGVEVRVLRIGRPLGVVKSD